MDKNKLQILYEYCNENGINDRLYKKCVEMIIKSKNPEYNYLFAKEISGADIKAHKQVVIESKNIDWIAKFAEIPGADKDAYKKVIDEIKPPEKKLTKVQAPKEIYPKSKKLRESVLDRQKVRKVLSADQQKKPAANKPKDQAK